MIKTNNDKSPVNPIILGKIGSCYGIHGWLRVFSSTENPESIFDYQPWFIQKTSKWKKLYLETWRRYNHGIIIKLKSIDNRNAANLLINCEIISDSSRLPNLKDENYYWKDLIGCRVINTEGFDFGKVVNIIETRSNDVLIVKANPKDAFGIRERLVPFLDEKIIKKVEIITRIIEVDWDPSF